MHVLYLCNEYPPFPHGGIGTFVQMMARQLVIKGHQASVVGFSAGTEFRQENDQGVNIYRFPNDSNGKLGLIRRYFALSNFIHRLHFQAAIDLIEGSELSFGLLPGRLPGKKIIRIHGGHHYFSETLSQPRKLSTSMIERLSFRRADYFCAVSRFAAETTGKLMGISKRPIEILPNPVDTQLFRPFPEIPEQDGLIVFTGGLREKKGVRQLLQAMPKIVEKYSSACLKLYGADINDRLTGLSFLHTLKNEIGPSMVSRIEFCGAVPHDDLPQINAFASVLVYPSWMETQGIVVIEGMASGKPVIASRTGPSPELITDGQDGLLCDPYSPESIAEKVLYLLGNPAMRGTLAINARKKVVANFSNEVIIPKNLAFYETCLAQ
jgi:glycosyltransferase involved in cell wall biosynthesis